MISKHIFMKIIAGSFIVCRTLAQQYDNFVCKKQDTGNENECATFVCESHSNGKSILPVDSIPLDTCSLNISTSGKGSLLITSADMFNKFVDLHTLKIHLYGSLEVTEKLSNSTPIQHLTKVLFVVPKLTTLSLEYIEFNEKNYSWMLPASIDQLSLSNGILEFDLRSCSRLSSLRLNNNKLTRIPSLHHPLPPLEILDLRNNPLDKFTMDDIAGLCNLKYLAMDAVGITNCECKKLKQWIVQLKERGDFIHEGSLNCNDNIDSSASCTIEDALMRRNECTDDKILILRTDFLESWKKLLILILIIVISIIFCCCLCSCIAFIAYKVYFPDYGLGMIRMGMQPAIPVPVQLYPMGGAGWESPY